MNLGLHIGMGVGFDSRIGKYLSESQDFFSRAENLDADAFDLTATDATYTPAYTKRGFDAFIKATKGRPSLFDRGYGTKPTASDVYSKCKEIYPLAGLSFSALPAKLKHDPVYDGLGDRMYFDGVDDKVLFDGTPFNSKTKGRITGNFFCGSSNSSIISATDKTDTNSDLTIGVSSSSKFYILIRENGSSILFATTTENFDDGTNYSFDFRVTDSGNELYIDGVLTTLNYVAGDTSTVAWFADVNDIDTLSVGNREESSPDAFLVGSTYDLKIYDEDGTTLLWSVLGTGNQDSDWTDQIGSNDGTVEGSPQTVEEAKMRTTLNNFVSGDYTPVGVGGGDRMYFDGVDDNVLVAHSAELDYAEGETIKLTATILADTYTSGNQYIIEKNQQYVMRIDSSGRLQFAIPSVAAATSDTTFTFTDGEQYTVEVEYNTSTNQVTYRRDGADGDTVSFSSSPNAGLMSDLYIGESSGASFEFGGIIWNVSVEIDGVLISSWAGTGNQDSDWTDQVGSNDGTVNGSPQTTAEVTGLRGNGSTKYIDLTLPQSTIGVNDSHLSAYVTTVGAGTFDNMIGSESASNTNTLKLRQHNVSESLIFTDGASLFSGNDVIDSDALTTGGYLIGKTSASAEIFKNGTQTESSVRSGSDRTPYSGNLYGFAVNQGGSAANYGAHRMTLLTAGEHLTDAEAEYLSWCVDAFAAYMGFFVFNPEADLSLTESFAVGSIINMGSVSGSVDRNQSAVFAVDFTDFDPDVAGLIFEAGGTGNGAWIGIDSNLDFINRCGSGDNRWNVGTAYEIISGSDRPSGDGTLVWEFHNNGSELTVRCWWNGVIIGVGVSGTSGSWSGSNDATYLTTSSQVPRDELKSPFTGYTTASELRYYKGQTVGV